MPLHPCHALPGLICPSPPYPLPGSHVPWHSHLKGSSDSKGFLQALLAGLWDGEVTGRFQSVQETATAALWPAGPGTPREAYFMEMVKDLDPTVGVSQDHKLASQFQTTNIYLRWDEIANLI